MLESSQLFTSLFPLGDFKVLPGRGHGPGWLCSLCVLSVFQSKC